MTDKVIKGQKALENNNPATLPHYEIEDVQSLQALQAGTATAEQQVRALKWIVESAGAIYAFHYYQNDRDEAFSLGRCFVAQAIVGVLRVNPMSLRRKENA